MGESRCAGRAGGAPRRLHAQRVVGCVRWCTWVPNGALAEQVAHRVAQPACSRTLVQDQAQDERESNPTHCSGGWESIAVRHGTILVRVVCVRGVGGQRPMRFELRLRGPSWRVWLLRRQLHWQRLGWYPPDAKSEMPAATYPDTCSPSMLSPRQVRSDYGHPKPLHNV